MISGIAICIFITAQIAGKSGHIIHLKCSSLLEHCHFPLLLYWPGVAQCQRLTNRIVHTRNIDLFTSASKFSVGLPPAPVLPCVAPCPPPTTTHCPGTPVSGAGGPTLPLPRAGGTEGIFLISKVIASCCSCVIQGSHIRLSPHPGIKKDGAGV